MLYIVEEFWDWRSPVFVEQLLLVWLLPPSEKAGPTDKMNGREPSWPEINNHIQYP